MGRQGRAGHVRPLRLGVLLLAEVSRHRRGVRRRAQPTKNLECLYNSRIGRNPTDAWCSTNGYPPGPTTSNTPHAASADGGIGLAPQQVLVNFLDNHDLPRFMFEKTDPNDAARRAACTCITWDGIPCVYYGTEQGFAGGVDPKNREDMFRGNEALGYAPFATDNETFKLVQGLIADAQGPRRAAPRHGDRRCGRRRSRARAAMPASSRSSASAPATRPRSSCSTRATQTSETLRAGERRRRVPEDVVPAGHGARRT